MAILWYRLALPLFHHVSLIVLPVSAVLVNVYVLIDMWLYAWSWSSATVALFVATQRVKASILSAEHEDLKKKWARSGQCRQVLLGSIV